MAAPLSPQTQHCWKEQNSPISSRLRASISGPTPLGRAQVWALLGHTLQSCLVDRAHLQWQDFVLEVVGRAAIASSVPRLSWYEPLRPQISLLRSRPHLLVCLLDSVCEDSMVKGHRFLSWGSFFESDMGKNLWERKEQEVVRSGRKGASRQEALRITWGNSPSRTHGYKRNRRQ